ncbi:MAG TPA: hypothetical protein VF298_02570 [Bacteroidales bacterium]
MKKVLAYLLILCGILFLLFVPSCKKDKKEETSSFDEAAQQSYQAAMNLQSQSLQVFNGYLSTQDTAAAKASLAAWFGSDAAVEWAKVSAQGVTVKYKNGICGGLILDLQRDRGEVKALKSERPDIPVNIKSLKNLPSRKKVAILAAFYNDFAEEVDNEENNWQPDFAYDGFTSTQTIKNGDVTLDLLTALNGYGVIDFNTHGVVWPDEVNTEEVFMVTHQAALTTTTKKYWDDIDAGNVGIITLPDHASVYMIKPAFITKYNDFKKDTVLFYGGFCYSALGSWPEIVNSCAAGTYFGFNWAVNSVKCANWAINLVRNMSNHSFSAPMTVEQWMTSTPEIPKQYFNAKLNKLVKIHYFGYSGLTFWKPDNNTTGGITATSADGAPILNPGYTCANYVLKCNLTGSASATLGYEWDYGDGSSTYYTVNDNLSLYHHWATDKSYKVKVTVTDYSTNTLVKEFTTVVNFVDPNYLPQLKTWTYVDLSFGPNSSIHMSDGSTMAGDYFYYDTSPWHLIPGSTPLTWTDSSFYAQCTNYNNGETFTIEGSVSADGRVMKHALFNKTYSIDTFLVYNSSFELTNLPLLFKDTLNCYTAFWYDRTGMINQTFVTRAELKMYDNVSHSYINISGIDWSQTYLDLMFTNE